MLFAARPELLAAAWRGGMGCATRDCCFPHLARAASKHFAYGEPGSVWDLCALAAIVHSSGS